MGCIVFFTVDVHSIHLVHCQASSTTSAYALPVIQSLSLFLDKPAVPVTGRPRFLSSSSITFQRPTTVSFSMARILWLCTLTLERRCKSSRRLSNCVSFCGLGSFAASVRICLTVVAAASLASGTRLPVSW